MRRKRIRWLFIILPIVALAIGSAVYLKRIGRELTRHLAPVLSQEASKRVNGVVKFGRIDIYPLGIVVSDISISQQHAEIVHIPKVKIACRIMDVIRRKVTPADSIKRIEVQEPTVHLVRSPAGKWNVLSIMKPSPGAKKLEFGGKVFVRSAHIILRDLKPDPTKPVVSKLDGVNAVVDFPGQSQVRFSTWNEDRHRQFGRLISDGTYNTMDHALRIAINVAGADARYCAKYPYHIGLNILSGKADAQVALTRAPKDKRIKYFLVATPRDVSMRFAQVKRPITGIDGKVYVQDGSASVKVRANLGSSPFTVAGDVSDFKHIGLGLGITSDRMNFREATELAGYANSFKQITLPSTGRIKAFISGPPKSLSIGFDATAPQIGWRGVTGRSVTALGNYTRGRIVIRRTSLIACGGQINASGTIELTRPTKALFTGHADGIRLNDVPMLAKQKLNTASSGNFEVSLEKGDTRIRYQGGVGSFSFQGLKFEQAKADISYAGGKTRLNEASARTLGGLVAVSGEISSDGKLDLDASAADINLAKVRDMFWKPATVGRGDLQGKVTGTLASPVFRGEIAAHKVMLAGIGAENITGNVNFSRKLLTIDNLVAHHYPGTVTVSGTVQNPISKSPTMHLTLAADSLEVSGLAESYGKYLPEGGKLTGQLIAYGPPRNPILTSAVRINGGTVYGVPLDAVTLDGQYSNNRLTIHELSVQSGESSLTVNGELDPDGNIRGSIESKQLALEKFSGLIGPYADVTGNLAVSGTIAGTLGDPSVDLSINCEEPVINYQVFERFGLKASLRGRTIALMDVAVSDHAATYAIPSVAYDMDSKELKLDARIQNGSVEKLVAILKRSPAATGPNHVKLKNWLSKLPSPLTGTLSASVSGTASLAEGSADPDIQADMLVSDAKIGSNAIKSVVLKGFWKDDVARLEKMEAVDGDLALSASGSIGPKRALDLRMNAKGLDIATICQWLDLPHNFSGKADVTVVAGGTTRAPSTEMNLDISDPVLGGVKFDKLQSRVALSRVLSDTAGEQQVQDRIDISDLMLIQGQHSLHVSGYIPIDLHTFEMTKGVPMLIQSNLDSDSLAILSKCTGLDMQTGLSGGFKGLVKLSGTSEKPVLEGDFDWTDGLVQVPKLNAPLENITARMHLVGDKLTIEELTGRSAEGGAFAVTGDVSFPGLRPTLDLEVKTDGLRVSGRNFSGIYGEDVRARLEGNLKITDNWRTPLITGNVDIPDGSIAMPVKPAKKKESVLSITPRFNVAVLLGDGVRFGAPRLKTPLMGKVVVQGSLAEPKVDGKLDISGGTILFPLHRFKIMPDSTVQVRMNPGQQPNVLIDMRAQGRMSGTSIWRRTQRYTVTMTAQGTLDKLNPEFTSSPPDLSEQQIIGMLAGQGELESLFVKDAATGHSGGLSGLFSSVVMPSVFEPISQSIENSLGIEEFSLQMGYQEPVQLTIGERLLDNFYLDYSTSLGARPDYSDSMYELQLSYRWKHGIEVGVKTDENRIVTVGVEGKLRF